MRRAFLDSTGAPPAAAQSGERRKKGLLPRGVGQREAQAQHPQREVHPGGASGQRSDTPLPRFPPPKQSVPRSETLAMLMALENTSSSLRLHFVTDHEGLIRAWPRRSVRASRGPNADQYEQFFCTPIWSGKCLN